MYNKEKKKKKKKKKKKRQLNIYGEIIPEA
jgi:hypothetical protein